MNYPKIELDKCFLSEGYASVDEYRYDVPTLIQYCKEQSYPVFDMPLSGVNIDILPWEISNMYDFCLHMDRVNKTSLEYPVILSPSGRILDGAHRICKAIIQGCTTIKCIRMQVMPDYSGKSTTTD